MDNRMIRTGRLRTVAVLLAATLAVTSGCAFGPPEPDRAGEPPRFPPPSAPADDPEHGDVAASVLAKGLKTPWGVAFLPDGSALVTERDTARILRVGPKSTTAGLTVSEVQTLTQVVADGEAGLLGIAVSPRYASDKTVFVSYSTATDNRVASLVLKGEPKPILTGLPRSSAHSGGQLAFGPDGYLYVTTAAGPTDASARDRKSLAGKILRMTVAGAPAPGNPVAGSLIWSSGHRNVQGLAWDAAKRMYATDRGQQRVDELNLIRAGRDYGWPATEGARTGKGMTKPLLSWPIAESSCAGVAMIERLVVTACLTGERLWLVETTAAGTVFGRPRPLLIGEYGRLRGVVAAPDGSLWLTTSNVGGEGRPSPGDDRIIRLVFAAGGAGRS